MKKKIPKKTQKKIIEILDNAFSFNILETSYNLFFIIVYSLCVTLLIIGVKYGLLEGYFQILISFIFSISIIEKIYIKINNLDERWSIFGTGLFIGSFFLIFNFQLLYIAVLSCCIILISFAIVYKYTRSWIIESLKIIQ